MAHGPERCPTSGAEPAPTEPGRTVRGANNLGDTSESDVYRCRDCGEQIRDVEK